MAINWEKILTDSDVYLVGVDVGCSSGRPQAWKRLGSALKYIGIDPLEAEIVRLQSLNEPNSKYLAGFVDFDGADGKADLETSRVFERTSAAFLAKNGFSSQKDIYNAGQSVTISPRKIGITEIMSNIDFDLPDLLKIDIDGGDFKCLKSFGAHGLLDNLKSLTIESQFHGDIGDEGNTLWNIGKLANTKNMSLYDLEVNRYSRSVLPSKFKHNFPAQTHFGQALWGDALFIDENLTGNPQYEDLIKLTAIFEIHGFFDCALEILEKYQHTVKSHAPVNEIMKNLRTSHESRENTINRAFLETKIRKFLKENILGLFK